MYEHRLHTYFCLGDSAIKRRMIVDGRVVCVLLTLCLVALIVSVHITRYARMFTVLYVVCIRVVQSTWIRSEDARSLMYPSLVRAILVSLANLAVMVSFMHVMDPLVWMRSSNEYYGFAQRVHACTVHAAWIMQLTWLSVVFCTTRKQVGRSGTIFAGQMVVVCTYTFEAVWIARELFIDTDESSARWDNMFFESLLLCLLHMLLLLTVILSMSRGRCA